MTEDRRYVLRRRNSRGEDEYIPVHVFTVVEYRCGCARGTGSVCAGTSQVMARAVRSVGCGRCFQGRRRILMPYGSANLTGSSIARTTMSPSSSTSTGSGPSNFAVERTAGSHSLAAAAHREL
jgi:hypothetical protein